MTEQPALPNLTNWVKQRVTAMYTATSREAFQDAFNAFLAKDVNVTVNGKHMTREKYMELLMGQKSLETGAEMHFFTTVTIPAGKDTQEAGEVGTAFKVTIDEKIIVGGAEESRTVNATMNVAVKKDNSIPEPRIPGRGGLFDARRVFTLNEVTTATQNPISLPHPRA